MTDPMKVLAELLTGSDAEPVYRHQDIHPIFVEQQKRIAELEHRAEAAEAKLATAKTAFTNIKNYIGTTRVLIGITYAHSVKKLSRRSSSHRSTISSAR